MRALATIIAAVLSVTTGGPLRCPCQFLPQVRAASAERVATPRAEVSSCRGCGCRAHQEKESPPPAPADSPPQERNETPHAPCPHGPGVDLTAPPGGVEMGDSEAGTDQPVLVSGGNYALTLSALDCVAPHPPSAPPSTCQHLRFCHAFRC